MVLDEILQSETSVMKYLSNYLMHPTVNDFRQCGASYSLRELMQCPKRGGILKNILELGGRLQSGGQEETLVMFVVYSWSALVLLLI